MRKSKPLIDTLDVKILKAVEKDSKPIMEYPIILKITHSTFKKKITQMEKLNWVKIKNFNNMSKYPLLQLKGKRVLKFVETFFE